MPAYSLETAHSKPLQKYMEDLNKEYQTASHRLHHVSASEGDPEVMTKQLVPEGEQAQQRCYKEIQEAEQAIEELESMCKEK